MLQSPLQLCLRLPVSGRFNLSSRPSGREVENLTCLFACLGQGVKKKQKKNIPDKQRTDSPGRLKAKKLRLKKGFSWGYLSLFLCRPSSLIVDEQEPKTSSKRPLPDDAADKGPGVKKRRKMNKEVRSFSTVF